MENKTGLPDFDCDVIIIGAGPAGLNAALSQALDGKKVLVLEKNNVPGGRHACFRRGKYVFQTAGDPPEKYLELEARIRELGGSIWYKTAAVGVTRFEDHAEVCLAGGRILRCREVPEIRENVAPDFTVWLGLDRPLKIPGEEDCEVLRISDPEAAERFEHIGIADYFREKDETAEKIVREYEKKHGVDLCGHITEMDAASPLTLYRYASGEGGSGSAAKTADALHPPIQFCQILKVIDRGHVKSFVIGPDPERGTSSLAYFRAGQYVSILDRVGEAVVCKPYSICSAPQDALKGENSCYTVMIERNPDGFFSPHALDTWQPGKKLILSGPLGYFYYQPLRDARHVVALAGSSGITPFFSMAAAIADGTEDFDLTILYGSRTADSILLRDELDALVRRSNGRVRVIHVLSDEYREGFESGLITPELIRKYAPDQDYSVFICGPKAMYDYLHRELPKLGLPERRIRFELPGEFGDPVNDPQYPRDAAGRTFCVTVKERDKERIISCRSDQTLMQAIERAGIVIEADCRSGQCGWCQSRLLSGAVFVPQSRESRQSAEIKYHRIHPCVTYPLSDIEMEIFNH